MYRAMLRYCGIINFPDDSQALSSVGANGVASTPFSSAIFTRLMNLWTRSTTLGAPSLEILLFVPARWYTTDRHTTPSKQWITKLLVNWCAAHQNTDTLEDWCTTELQHQRRYTSDLIMNLEITRFCDRITTSQKRCSVTDRSTGVLWQSKYRTYYDFYIIIIITLLLIM